MFGKIFSDVWNLATIPELQTLLKKNPNPSVTTLLRTEGINREIDITSEELYNLILTEEYMIKLLKHMEERNPLPHMIQSKQETKTNEKNVNKETIEKEEEEEQKIKEEKEEIKTEENDDEETTQEEEKEEQVEEKEENEKEEEEGEQQQQEQEEEEEEAPITVRELLVHGVTITNMLAKDMDAIFDFAYLLKPYLNELYSETMSERAMTEGPLSSVSKCLLKGLYYSLMKIRPNTMIPLLWDIEYFTFDIINQQFSLEKGIGDIILVTKNLSISNQMKHHEFLKKIDIEGFLLNEIENRPTESIPLLKEMIESGSENLFPILRERSMLTKLIQKVKNMPLTTFGPFESYLNLLQKLLSIEHIKSNIYTKLIEALDAMKEKQIESESNALQVDQHVEKQENPNPEKVVIASDDEEEEGEEVKEEQKEAINVPKGPIIEPVDNLKLILEELLDFLIDILKNPKRLELGRFKTTFGILSPPLGSIRLAIVSFIHELFKLKNHIVDTYLNAKPELIDYLTDLFFFYEFNNMYHEHYLGIFRIICVEKHMPLLDTLFTKCRLISRLLAAVSSNNAHEKTRKGARRGYMGHLMSIFQMLEVEKLLNSIPIVQARHEVFGYDTFIKTEFLAYLEMNDMGNFLAQFQQEEKNVTIIEEVEEKTEESPDKFEVIENEGDELVVCVKSDDDDHPDVPEREPEEIEEFIAFDEENNQLIDKSRPTFVPDEGDIPTQNSEFTSTNWWTHSDIDAFSI